MRYLVTKEEFTRSESECRNFILKNGIVSPSKGEKAINDLTRNLSYCLVKNGILGRRFNRFTNDYLENRIIDISFLLETGEYNWLDFVSSTYKDLATDLFQCRPVGLGSPNSACGEAEFMLLCLSPNCSKPTRGDVKIVKNGQESIIELKGENPRVTSSVTGISFRNKTLDLCIKYGLEPNISLRGNISGVQLTSGGIIQDHWRKQFEKINLDERKKFLNEWLVLTGAFTSEEAEFSSNKILKDGLINIEILKKEIIKLFFKHQISIRTEFTNMAFFNGSKVKIITNNFDKFAKLVDDGKIKPSGDYFRLNQNTNIAWYIECI